MSALSKTEISMKSTDYATIKLTCRPNLLNSRPQRIGFYSKLEIPACIQGLTDLKLVARVSKIHDRISITHALVFIIFSGCATLELIYLDQAFTAMVERRQLEERSVTRRDLYDAIMEGAVERVRPKMMTVSAIMAGLLPIMWSTGTGSEVMQRIAAPMIGGMISSTILTLIVIPAVYGLIKGWGLPAYRSMAVH